MTKQEIEKLVSLLNPPDIKDKIASRVRALEWVQSQKPTVEPKKPRSTLQNSSLHLWLSMIAHEANNMGLTLQNLVEKVQKIEIRPSTENLKEIFVKPYIKSAYNLDSTTKMNTEQLNETYDAMNKLFSYYWHISIPFPCDENRPTTLKNIEIARSLPDYPSDIYNGESPTI